MLRDTGLISLGMDSLEASAGADDRGGAIVNNRVSLTLTRAGEQLSRTGSSWANGYGSSTTVTFAFRGEAPGSLPNGATGFQAFDAQQITATLKAMQGWSDVANVTFQRIQDPGSTYVSNATLGSAPQISILIGGYTGGAGGAASFSFLPAAEAGLPANRASSGLEGDIWLNLSLSENANPRVFGQGFMRLTVEVGHAIGLSDPADYHLMGAGPLTYSVNAIYAEDTRQYSVFSRFSETHTGANFAGAYAAAPMMDDIAAAQRFYGANMTTRTGDTVYGFGSTADRDWFNATGASAVVFAVWDAGGVDTFNFSSYHQAAVIDLRQGAFSSVGGLIGNVGIVEGVVIENAIGGSGADILIGNSADNALRGMGGSDVIDGGLGTDRAVFSGARAAYSISWNGPVATVTGPDGADTLINVELFQFDDQTVAATPTGGLRVSGDATADTITGSSVSDELDGGAGPDAINGLAGDDLLRGGRGDDVINGGPGDDIIRGGLGDDWLIGGDGWDILDLSDAPAGVDGWLNTPANATNFGGAGRDIINGFEEVIGTAFDDVLRGDGGHNVIRGGGGADVLFGSSGNDILIAGPASPYRAPRDYVNQPASQLGNAVNITSYDRVVTTLNGDGVRAYYAFSVTAGETMIFDIDGASFDSVLRVLNGSGQELAVNNDNGGLDVDGGIHDAYIRFTALQTQTIYVEVSRYVAGGFGGQPLQTGTLGRGSSYVLDFYRPGGDFIGASFPARGSTLHGGVGDDTLIAGDGLHTLNGDEWFDTADYSAVDRALTVQLSTAGLVVGSAADRDGGPHLRHTLRSIERVIATRHDDQLIGTNWHDSFCGGGGSDIISGALGFDVAEYLGLRKGYGVANSASVSGGVEGGTDTLSGVEELRFADGSVTFNADSQAAQLMRLYSAAFDRAPDSLGFHIQLNALEAGVSTAVMAQRFLDSAEFSGRFGTLTNTQYIQRLYANALNRQPSNSEINDWLSFFNNGGSRAQLLVIFAESTEHRAITGATLNQGLWVGDDAAEALARLYDVAFDRNPDQSGFINWRASLATGQTLLDAATAFLNSAEGQAKFAGLSNTQFVTLVYQQAFERAPDAGGLAAYVTGLTNGTITRAQMLVEFAGSAEHIALTTPRWVGGIPFQGAPTAPDDVAKAEDVQAPQVQPEIDGGKDAGKAEDGALVLPDQTDGDAFVLPARPAHGASAVDGVRLTEPQVQIELATEEAKAEVALVLPDDAFVLTKADMDAQPLVLPDAGTETLELSSEAPAAVDPLADLPFIERPDLPVHFDPLDLLIHRDHGPWGH